MAEETDRGQASRFMGYVCVLMIGVLLIYILSVGPAIVVANKVPSTGDTLATIYRPLEFLGEHTFLHKPLEAYVNFWIKSGITQIH